MNIRKSVCATLPTTLPLAAAAGPGIHSGLWETRGRMEVPGLGVDLPAVSFTLSIGENGLSPEDLPLGEGCEPMERSVSGNQLSWRIRCDVAGLVTTDTGEIGFDGDTYEGDITLGVADGQETAEMTQHLQGHRIGDCPSQE